MTHRSSRRTARIVASASALFLFTACGEGSLTVREPQAVDVSSAAVVVFDDRDRDLVWSNRDAAAPEATVIVHDQNISVRETLTPDADGRVELAIPDGVTDLVVEVNVSLEPAEGSERRVPVTVYASGSPGSTSLVPLSFGSCPSLDECPDVLLPDLVPLSQLPDSITGELAEDYPGPDQWYLDRETIPGSTLLRIATLTANLGEGPLIVTRGAVTTDLSSADVYQRLLTGTGTHVDVKTGSFTHHEEHEHVHLDAFEQLRLLDLEGNEVARSEKLSFCLTDVLAVDDDLVSEAPIRVDLEPWGCSAYEQGINAGFVDYYGPSLADQWIDITSVPSGTYVVEFTADPDNVLIESDETNNVSTLQIELDLEL